MNTVVVSAVSQKCTTLRYTYITTPDPEIDERGERWRREECRKEPLQKRDLTAAVGLLSLVNQPFRLGEVRKKGKVGVSLLASERVRSCHTSDLRHAHVERGE